MQVFAARLGVVDVYGDVVLRHRLDRDPVRSLHHQPVNSDVLDVVVVPVIGIARDDAGLVDVVAAVATVQSK